MLTQRNLDLHARIGIISKYLDDASDWLSMPAWLLDDFDHDHLPVPGLEFLIRRNQNILADPLVFRHHDNNAMFD